MSDHEQLTPAERDAVADLISERLCEMDGEVTTKGGGDFARLLASAFRKLALDDEWFEDLEDIMEHMP